MSSYRIRVRATDDLNEIAVEGREKWGDAKAERYLAKFVHTFELLAEMPQLGKACDDIKPGWRRLSEGVHMVYYCIASDGVVDIQRLLPARMDPDLLLDNDEDD